MADENLQLEFKKTLIWLNNQYIEQRYQELSLKQNHTKEERIQLTKLIAVIKVNIKAHNALKLCF